MSTLTLTRGTPVTWHRRLRSISGEWYTQEVRAVVDHDNGGPMVRLRIGKMRRHARREHLRAAE